MIRAGPRPRGPLLPLLLALAAAACIEDRLNVEIRTQVHADGSCTRRIEYRLERFDTQKGDAPVEIPTDQDPLRLFHRFPSGEAWSVSDEAKARAHTVVAEATLASPNDLDWDYWRAWPRQSSPARNHVSFAMTGGDDPVFEYAETFLDPASPAAWARLFVQVLSRHADAFATALQGKLAPRSLRRDQVKRAFRDELVLPLTRRIDAIADRPLFGPRERKELDALFENDSSDTRLVEALAALAPGADIAQVKDAMNDALEALQPTIERDMAAAGLPFPALLPLADSSQRTHFRATLILPAAIVRANTCFQGDTATWEFDGVDLYGRGFEMWAKAGAR